MVCKVTSVTGKHVANQCKSVFSEYGWPDTLISDNSPCYTSQAFTSVIQAFSVNHITSSPRYPQSNGLAEKYAQIVKCLFNNAKEEEKDFHKCLMIYCNLTCRWLANTNADLTGKGCKSNLPMSNAVRNKLGLQPEMLRNIHKHEKLPTHDLHVGQHVRYKDSTNKQWHPTII